MLLISLVWGRRLQSPGWRMRPLAFGICRQWTQCGYRKENEEKGPQARVLIGAIPRSPRLLAGPPQALFGWPGPGHEGGSLTQPRAGLSGPA